MTGAKEGFSWFKQESGARPSGGAGQLSGQFRLEWAQCPARQPVRGRNAEKCDICLPATSPHYSSWSSCFGEGRKLAFSHCYCVPDRFINLSSAHPPPLSSWFIFLFSEEEEQTQGQREVWSQSCSFHGTGKSSLALSPNHWQHLAYLEPVLGRGPE